MRASPSFLGPSLSICNALVLLTCTCGTLGTALLPAWTSTHASLCDSTFNSAKTVFGTNFAQCYALCAKTANCSQFAVTNANWHQQSKNPACNLAPPCAEQCTTSPGYCKNWNTYTCASGAAATCSSPLPPTPGPGPGPGPPPPPPPPPAPITFKLSATLHDSMVLQRAPAAAVVWGFAPRGTTVTTTFGGETIISTANSTTVGAPHCCVWRAKLPPTAANSTPQTISFAASTGERATLQDVLFGDVYICGGQSNMAFSVGGNENAAAYRKEADKYPSIRLFTVGQGTKSHVPRSDLATIEQNWEAASSTTVSDGSRFNYFSAVCWFFGKNVHDGLGGTVPIGLVSNNWPGTKVEQWTPPETTAQCGHAATGELYNAMIVPYTVGPMAVSGFAWYQGESDVGGTPDLPDQNFNYTCTQTAMIQQWRSAFEVPDAFFAVVQLSTWLYPHAGETGTVPHLLAAMRDQQLASGTAVGKGFAYATNADYGAGNNIHPPYKQHVGQRLANAALSIVYGQPIDWRSPTYASAAVTTAIGVAVVTVSLHDVEGGLVLKPAFNHGMPPMLRGCAALNTANPGTCAFGSVQFNDAARSWVNATVGLSVDKKAIVLGARAPPGATTAIATSYGWGSVPMMTVYRADMDGEDGQLPVLPWNKTL